MNKDELESRLEEVEKQSIELIDEIKELKAQLAKVQNEPEIPDFPTFETSGEEAWHIDNSLEVSTPWTARGTAWDFNSFHSKEMAQEFSRKCKLIAMMLHCKWYLDRDYVPDFSNTSEEKYFVCYDNFDYCFKYFSARRFNDYVIFSTKEAAQKCADWLNKHWKEDDNGKANSKTP